MTSCITFTECCMYIHSIKIHSIRLSVPQSTQLSVLFIYYYVVTCDEITWFMEGYTVGQDEASNRTERKDPGQIEIGRLQPSPVGTVWANTACNKGLHKSNSGGGSHIYVWLSCCDASKGSSNSALPVIWSMVTFLATGRHNQQFLWVTQTDMGKVPGNSPVTLITELSRCSDFSIRIRGA